MTALATDDESRAYDVVNATNVVRLLAEHLHIDPDPAGEKNLLVYAAYEAQDKAEAVLAAVHQSEHRRRK